MIKPLFPLPLREGVRGRGPERGSHFNRSLAAATLGLFVVSILVGDGFIGPAPMLAR